MATNTIIALKKVARMFRVPLQILILDFKDMKKHNKEMSDDQLVGWMIDDLAEGMAS